MGITMANMKLLLIGIIPVILSGCAAAGSRYSDVISTQQAISSSKARLIVFRTKESMQYSARAATVKIDSGNSGSCDYGGFSTFDVPEGKHVIAIDMWDTPGKCELPIDVSGGISYYFEVQPRLANLLSILTFGAIGASVESGGSQCGGAFSINSVEQGTALLKLNDLRATK